MSQEVMLEQGKKSRRQPLLGGVFAYRLKMLPDRYSFGRVIKTGTTLGGFPDVMVVYFYRASSTTTTEIPALLPTELLVPPIGTNHLPWVRGYFTHIKSGVVETPDLLPVHGFKDYLRNIYVNEFGKPIPKPDGPIGAYALTGIGAIGEKLAKALKVDVLY